MNTHRRALAAPTAGAACQSAVHRSLTPVDCLMCCLPVVVFLSIMSLV